MKLKLLGRVALLACVSVGMVCGLTSCATSTLGYLYVTVVEYGQVASLRLDINSGQIKSVTCNTGNGDQGNCITSSGGSYPTKIVLASNDTLMYVLNTSYKGNPASITLLTLGSSGSVFTTGQSYLTYGQDPVDMYLSPTGNFLYVLNQYLPADVSTDCASPTPSTCKGGINAFSIDGKGDLTPVICGTGDGCLNGNSTADSYVFPIGYEPGPLNSGYGGSRMLAINSFFYVLDESAPGTPEVRNLSITSTGALQTSQSAPTTNPAFAQLSSMIGESQMIYISDYQTGQVWVYQPTTTGLTQLGVVCPSQPDVTNPSSTACKTNPAAPTTNNQVQIDTMATIGTFLYIADYNTGTIYTMQSTPDSPYLVSTGNGFTILGTNTTCLTISSSPQFLYAAGTGTVVGEQINTSTGALSTSLHPTAGVPFTGVVPCVMFTPRT